MKLSTGLTFALAYSTSAFTSISRKSSNTALQMSELNIPGALPPVGLFDPLGFAAKANDATLLRYREAEVTHGRVAMLAAVGFLVGEKVEGSSFLFDAQVSGPAISHLSQVPTAFWLIFLIAIGAGEQFRAVAAFEDPKDVPIGQQGLMRADHFPGDIGFDPLGLKPEDPEEFEIMVTKELQHGRLAMLAAAGFMAQELADGKGIIEHLQSS
jgi:hypothetical protein